MAAASLAIPGRPGGACAVCSHLDCIAARQIAVERCRLCHEQIGFDRPFYSEPDAKIHSECLEEELTRKLKAGLPDASTRFLTVEETAELLRVEVETVRNWVSQGKIPFRKAGSKTLFLLEEILNWTMPESRTRGRAGLSLSR